MLVDNSNSWNKNNVDNSKQTISSCSPVIVSFYIKFKHFFKILKSSH